MNLECDVRRYVPREASGTSRPGQDSRCRAERDGLYSSCRRQPMPPLCLPESGQGSRGPTRNTQSAVAQTRRPMKNSWASWTSTTTVLTLIQLTSSAVDWVQPWTFWGLGQVRDCYMAITPFTKA